MEDFFKFIGITLSVIIFICVAPFVVLHVMNNWDKPSYPHSGFSPEQPTWEAQEEDIPNTRRK